VFVYRGCIRIRYLCPCPGFHVPVGFTYSRLEPGRFDALENGADRKATRKADHAALATSDARGITKDERKRLRDLIAVVHGTDMPEGSPAKDAKGNEERREDSSALRKWFVGWSETERAVIKRRDHLIRLGLAKRKQTPKGPPSGGAGG